MSRGVAGNLSIAKLGKVVSPVGTSCRDLSEIPPVYFTDSISDSVVGLILRA